MIEITRKIEFDAGHRIPDHQHQCKHLHGHRYVLELSVVGEIKQQDGACDNGMVADFGVLKSILKTHLIDLWDHAFLVWEKDEKIVRFLQTLPNHKTVILKNVPTVENLAQTAFAILNPVLSEKNLKINRLKLYETPNSWAQIQTPPKE